MRIRIPVIVAKNGKWNAGGYGRPGDELMKEAPDWLWDGMADDVPDCDCHVVFVTADVPLPEPREVAGEVRT